MTNLPYLGPELDLNDPEFVRRWVKRFENYQQQAAVGKASIDIKGVDDKKPTETPQQGT